MSMMMANGNKYEQIVLHEDIYLKLRKLKFALEKDSFNEIVEVLINEHEGKETSA